MDRKQKVLIGLSVALFLVTCVLFRTVAATLVFAATLSVVLVPAMDRLEGRLRNDGPSSWRTSLLAGAFTVATVGALLLVVALVTYIFVRNFPVLEDFGLQVATKVEETARDVFGTAVDLRSRAGESLDQLLGYVQGTLAALARALVELIIFSSALYLFLRHGTRLRSAIEEALPDDCGGVYRRLADVTYSSLYAIYVVHVATAVVTVLLALPFFHLIGFREHLLFWSILCGSFQLVPVLGPSLIMIAIAIYGFAQGDPTTGALILLVGYPVVAAFPDLVVRPLLLRRQMKIDAAVLILGFFAGIVSMGMIGFVLGPLLLKLLVESLQTTREELLREG